MNMPDKSSFGTVSHEVHRTIGATLKALEEAPKASRKRFPAALAAAMALVLATTAFAIAGRAVLTDFFAKWNLKNGYELPETFTDVVRTGKPLLAATAGDLDVVVTDAVGDGSMYYFSTTISIREGIAGHLVNTSALENGILSAPSFGDGLPVYYFTMEMVGAGYGSETIDWIDNEDGSVTFFRDTAIRQTGDRATMECWVTYARVDDGFLPLQDQFVTEILSFDIPVDRKEPGQE